MSHESPILTWDLLNEFGFVPDDLVISDQLPGLSYDFGNLTLSASSVMNFRLAEIILFGGVLATRRSISEISFEMPRRVMSRLQCAAWIAWYLDQAAGQQTFTPTRQCDWLTEGRKNLSLLPWIADRIAYGARSYCEVRCEWLRIALKSLKAILASASDADVLVLSFEDGVLTIRCVGEVVAFPAKGKSWGKDYAIPVERVRQLPKRLMTRSIEISIYDGRLVIGHRCYDGAIETKGIEAQVP